MITARELAAQKVSHPRNVTRLRQARAETGLSAEDIAAALGFYPSALYKWERGGVYPQVPTALRLARFYETTVEELFTPIGHPPEEEN